MKNPNVPSWMKQLTGFAGIIGASALIGFPAWAHINSQTTVANATQTQQVAGNVKPAAAPASMAATKDIVAIASGDAQFNTLTKALGAADLVTTLQGKGPFTVFAPTDAAFAALPKATLDDLLKPANKAKLTKILTYHVVPGAVLSTSLKSGEVATVEKSKLKVEVKGGKVKVGGANVVKADIKASNGVIHVIDKVLMPPDVK
ncbi:fasciclin domain-containing protein [Tychonema sp. LEGE 07203]|uniref:fasciclin domain-containing protein n=1 Tax=Tychonema sp. LEGE 07203 TaxID=1828671 RepID=UPI001881E103|nr:fasciclin domain-containing protein [Tychonema sp. LEGE 07203]MBE9096133.1 fasciclin domain-containing protein [Tychonema sp. LEGE 07203]